MEDKVLAELLATQKQQLDLQQDMAMTLERDIQSAVEVRQLQKQELEDSMAYRADTKVTDKQRTIEFDRREDERLQLFREDMVLRRAMAEEVKNQTRLLERIANAIVVIARNQ